MTYTAAIRDIVQEAYGLLRQDYSAPDGAQIGSSLDAVTDNASGGTPTVDWLNTRTALVSSANEVYDAFDWGEGVTADNPGAWPCKMRNALVYALARALAVPVGGRVEDLKNWDSLYRDKLLQAEIRVLNDKLAANTDPILAQLLMNFKGDDASLVRSYAVYTQRIANATTICEKEVKSQYEDWQSDNAKLYASNPAKLWEAPCEALIRAKIAPAMGFDANLVQIYEQEYATKLAQAKTDALNDKLKTISDPILSQLLATFRNDSPALARAYEAYTRRVDAVLPAAEWEVKSQLKAWANDNTRPSFKSARKQWEAPYEALARAKLAAVMGFDANIVNLYQQEYATKLAVAKANELNAELAAVKDEETKEVVSSVVADFKPATDLPYSCDSIVARIESCKATAREDVLLAHEWTFATRTEPMPGTRREEDATHLHLPYVCPLPSRAIRLLAVLDRAGKLLEWRIENRFIFASGETAALRYVVDVEDVSKWHVQARSLYMLRLKALAARALGSAQAALSSEQLYQVALANAKLRDTSETNAPSDAWDDCPACNPDPYGGAYRRPL